MTRKIVRTICKFSRSPGQEDLLALDRLAAAVNQAGFEVQTLRLCSPDAGAIFKMDSAGDGSVFMSIGARTPAQTSEIFEDFIRGKNVAFNLDLSAESITRDHAGILFDIIRRDAAKTFSFTYTFNVPASSPYFPSAAYAEDGFAVGLQPTDLSEGAGSIAAWLARLKDVWHELDALLAPEPGYLGIDTSIAPLYDGPGSLLEIVRREGLTFDEAATSDVFLGISAFIKNEGARNTGLCGLMFPCLEDFPLADEYEAGNFPIERNLFLSLHSGLGIDSYPIGVDERPERVVQILRLVQALSNRYRKPLSARFISDGRARIGETCTFGNPYLKDVVVRAL